MKKKILFFIYNKFVNVLKNFNSKYKYYIDLSLLVDELCELGVDGLLLRLISLFSFLFIKEFKMALKIKN